MAKAAQTVTAPVDDAEAAQAAMEAVTGAEAEYAAKGPVVPPGDAEAYTSTGTRVSRAFGPKMLLPGGDAGRVWIAENVLTKPVGSIILLGRVFGVATSYEKRTNEWQGKQIASIAISGVFQAESKDGEVWAVSQVFLPMAFAIQIAEALDMEGNRVQMDVDIGLSPTGKSIPYEWAIVTYLEGRAQRAVRAIAGQRKIGQPPANVGAPLLIQ